MYRLTTPTITFHLPETVDLTQADEIFVTFANRQQKKILEKNESELTITATTVGVFLTQEETKTGHIMKMDKLKELVLISLIFQLKKILRKKLFKTG